VKHTWAVLLAAVALHAAPLVIRVRQGSATLELPLERYVAAVLAGESAVFRSDEAMKAMAVGVRTFAIRNRGRHAAEGFDFCSSTHCQRVDLDAVTPRLESVAAATQGELLWFGGKLAMAYYTADCGGHTEDAGSLWAGSGAPYLKGVEDEWCTRAGALAWQWSADPLAVAGALRRAQLHAPPAVERIDVAQRTSSGRARILILNGGGESVRISASTFRFAMGRELGWNTVRSERYDVLAANGHLLFQGSGAGHGVGLCQRGADEMGVAGRSYRDILSYYFPGTAVGITGRGLAWQRLGGESIALLTTQPGQDASVLSLAERQLREAARRTGLAPPAGVEIRVYPDVETFRNATGEPGWVAARTQGRRIELQPAALLRSRGVLERTMWHEVFHVLLEAQAVAGLPVWFREGLAEYLERPVAGVAAGIPTDEELRQTSDSARARRAYAEAAGAVAALVRRYGEPVVLTWLRTGLPAGVRTATGGPPL